MSDTTTDWQGVAMDRGRVLQHAADEYVRLTNPKVTDGFEVAKLVKQQVEEWAGAVEDVFSARRRELSEVNDEADKWAAAYRDAKQEAQRVTADLEQQLAEMRREYDSLLDENMSVAERNLILTNKLTALNNDKDRVGDGAMKDIGYTNLDDANRRITTLELQLVDYKETQNPQWIKWCEELQAKIADLEQQLAELLKHQRRTTTLLKQADKFGVSNAWWREVKEALKEQDKCSSR